MRSAPDHDCDDQASRRSLYADRRTARASEKKVILMGRPDIYVPPQRIGIKPFSQEAEEQARALIASALEAFGLTGYSVALVSKHSNITAKLISPEAPPLALRVRSAPGVDARTEFTWLQAVRNGTDLDVVRPWASSFAENTRLVQGPDGSPVECSLFYWVPGEPLAAHLTPENYSALGLLTARLHDFAAGWRPPHGLKPLCWNRCLYYTESQFVIDAPAYRKLISPADAEVVRRVKSSADAELERLSRLDERFYLHGNIEMWNVVTTGPRKLTLIDFEDVMFGHPALDVASTSYYGRERPDYLDLIGAFRSGYTDLREWPVRDDRQLALLMAARAIMLLNHALQTEEDKQDVVSRLLPTIMNADV